MNRFKLLMIIFMLLATPQRVAYAQKQLMSVAIDHSPPYSYIDEKGRPRGLIVDVMDSLSAKLPYAFEYVECPWARCLKLVEQGEIDLLPGIKKTPTREAVFVFIEPAFFNQANHFRFYSLKTSKPITQFDDLTSLTIGALRGASHTPEFDDNSSINKTLFVDVSSMFNALEKQRIDAFIYHDDTINPLLNEFDTRNAITASPLNLPGKRQGYIVISKDSKHIMRIPEITEQLSNMVENGDLERIFKQYGLAY